MVGAFVLDVDAPVNPAKIALVVLLPRYSVRDVTDVARLEAVVITPDADGFPDTVGLPVNGKPLIVFAEPVPLTLIIKIALTEIDPKNPNISVVSCASIISW